MLFTSKRVGKFGAFPAVELPVISIDSCYTNIIIYIAHFELESHCAIYPCTVLSSLFRIADKAICSGFQIF